MYDGEPALLGELEDDARQFTRCGGGFGQKQWFSGRLQFRDQWVVLLEDHAMVEVLINPPGDVLANIREIEHHSAIVQRWRFQDDQGSGGVAVEVLATAGGVAEYSVAIAKVDFPGDLEHELSWKNW
ncbi:MAG: hypothetical protein R3E01_23310 [Pirellulaceae bacterium]